MLLMDADGDMLFMDEGAGLVEADADGIGMLIMGEPPRKMLWWIATHQFQTFSCGAPAATPRRWPSSWVQIMYSKPLVKLRSCFTSGNARGAAEAGNRTRSVQKRFLIIPNEPACYLIVTRNRAPPAAT